MRTSLILLATLSLALLPTFASAATRLTEQQVRNVCGGGLQSGGGNIGCTKKCGTNMCDYNCKDGKCEGRVVTLIRNDQTFQMPLGGRSLIYGDSSDERQLKVEIAD